MISALITREGGYSDHPADKGGPTKYGITKAVLAGYMGRNVSAQEVRDLSPEMAAEIYYVRYYVLPRIDALPPAIQPLMLDMSANHGPKNAIRFLQHVINLSGITKIEEDGICGPKTQKAAGEAYAEMQEYLINALVEERLGFYHSIISRDPSQFVFLKGWERRAEEFRI